VNSRHKQKVKFRVNRKTWYRGESLDSVLLRHDGTKCCLGFLALKLGYRREQIEGVSEPVELVYTYSNRWPRGLVDKGRHTQICTGIIQTNDSESLTERERERELTRLFKLAGVAVEFYGNG